MRCELVVPAHLALRLWELLWLVASSLVAFMLCLQSIVQSLGVRFFSCRCRLLARSRSLRGGRSHGGLFTCPSVALQKAWEHSLGQIFSMPRQCLYCRRLQLFVRTLSLPGFRRQRARRSLFDLGLGSVIGHCRLDVCQSVATRCLRLLSV